MTDLLDLRNKIDAIDDEILNLISQRATIAKEVGKVKQQAGEADKTLFYIPEREAQVLRRMQENNQGPLNKEAISNIYRSIVSACLSLEQQLQISFLGPKGTFSYEASLKHFGLSAQFNAMYAIDEVFREVAASAANFGVVPVENSTEGSISSTLDCLIRYNVKVCGEIELPVHHYLMTSKAIDMSKRTITRIYSHGQALAQCRTYLDRYYPNAERIAVSSTAEAAKRMQLEWNAAAIASFSAANIYDLDILAKNIEDNPENTTRFLVIGQQETKSSGNDKTSIIITAKNRSGALADILNIFKKHNIDLTRLETRPSQESKWSYVFFVDFFGHLSEEKVKNALQDLQDNVQAVAILGSYPIAVI